MTAVIALTGLAVLLRLLGALLRPVWVDEAATAIFTAGNSSWSTPINTLVPLDSFVKALRLDAHSSLPEALAHLRLEDNHPPLHFALGALAARLMQPHGAVLDPLTARLPAVVLGSLAVPLLHQAVAAATGGRRAARLAAAWIAVSPLAVAMGLEARHYALATTLACGALWGLAASWRRPLPAWAAVAWTSVNLLGVMSHHLFVVVIAAQLATVIGLRMVRWRQLLPPLLALGLSGLWLLGQGPGGAPQQTSWLDLDPQQPLQWLAIPLQMLLTALCGLVAPGTSLSAAWQWPILILAAVATLVGLISLVRLLNQAERPQPLLLVFTLCSAASLLAVCLLSGKDLSRALRYGYVYLPGVVALVAVAADQAIARHGKATAAVLLCCSLICSVGVASGVALPASYNPDLLINKVAAESSQPVVLAFNEQPVPTGKPLIGYEALSIAWHLHSRARQDLGRAGIEPRLLLLLGDGRTPPEGLKPLAALKGPFDLWLINAHGTRSLDLPRRNCRHLGYASAGGHLHHHYRCNGDQPGPANKKPDQQLGFKTRS